MASVTIASITIPNWQGNLSGVQLHIFAMKSFTASSGTFYPKGNPLAIAPVGGFFQSYNCTYSAGSLVIPAVTLDSTVDSTDAPDATYCAILFDSQSGRNIQPFGAQPFALNTSPTSTTWAVIFAAEADS